MRRLPVFGAVAFFVSALGAPGDGSTRAPVPAVFTSEADHPADGTHVPVPDMQGTYAHGFADELWSVDFEGAPCTGTVAEQAAVLASLPAKGMREFWFYATRMQGVLLTRSARLTSTKPCASALSYHYDTERAYVANGFIHSMSIDRDGTEPIGSSPMIASAGQYSSSFERLHSLMARPQPRVSDRNLGAATVAGIRSNCRGQSGLVWWSICTAASGPVRGMILSAMTGDDEKVMFRTELIELRTGVSLPGELFEIDRTWTGKP